MIRPSSISYMKACARKSPGPVILSVPTANEVEGNFSAAGLPQIYDPSTTTTVGGVTSRQPIVGNIITTPEDPIAKKIINYWPLPNYGGPNALVNNYYYMGGTGSNQNRYDAKIDYNISSNHRMSSSFLAAWVTPEYYNAFANGVCPGQSCGDVWQHEPQFVISEVWSASPSMVNNIRFSYLGTHVHNATGTTGTGYATTLGLANPGANAWPNIAVSGTLSLSTLSGPAGANLREHTFTPNDVFTWIKGRLS